MTARTAAKSVATPKPKVSELRERFEFIKASFAIEGIQFSQEELCAIEESIRKRHRGPGFISGVWALLDKRRARCG
jgi:hypothetical protein